MNLTKNKRVFEIDVLRGIAVILVMFRHFHTTDYKVRIPVLQNIGWIGVDLFFVLSGFLISTLLYKEIDKHGNINFKRFFIRRGFKIYPSFYFLILFTVIVKLISGKEIESRELVAECFFLQSYIKGMLVHTWSLGVEEHFYIFLPLLLIVFVKVSKQKMMNTGFISLAFIVIATFCLFIRCYNVYFTPLELYKNIFNTHVRMDSLFFGVLLSYYYRYNNPLLKSIVCKYYPVFVLYCILVIPVAYFFDVTSVFIVSVGFTLLYIAFGMVLLLALFAKDIFNTEVVINSSVLKLIALIGFYSYTIYLWHIPAEAILNRLNIYYKWNIYLGFALYLVISVVAGVISSKIIEIPALRIRDNYFKDN
jgi:peptidoglycan/LPS O-acetylase OafA/YrhL